MKLYFSLFLLFICGCAAVPQQTNNLPLDTSPEQTPGFLSLEVLTDALNTEDYSILEPWIDDDFAVPGVPEKLVESVLKQVVNSFSKQVLSYTVIDQEVLEDCIKLKTEFVLKEESESAKTEKKEYEFTLSSEGKFLEMGIFKVETKQRKKAEKEQLSVPAFMQVKLNKVGNLIGTLAEVDGREGLFLIDSGAPSLVLNTKQIESDPVESLGGMGVGGEISGVNIITIDEFKWQDYKKVDCDVLTMDLSHLEVELETEIMGLIGFEELENFEFIIDYEKLSLLMFGLDEAGEKIARVSMAEPEHVLKFDLQGHIPVFESHIGDKDLHLGLDTGAETNLLDIALYSEIKVVLKDIREDQLSGADKGNISVQKGIVPVLEVDGVNFENQTTVFSDISHLNDGYGLSLDGLIGYPVLSNQKVGLNFRLNTLMLWR